MLRFAWWRSRSEAGSSLIHHQSAISCELLCRCVTWSHQRIISCSSRTCSVKTSLSCRLDVICQLRYHITSVSSMLACCKPHQPLPHSDMFPGSAHTFSYMLCCFMSRRCCFSSYAVRLVRPRRLIFFPTCTLMHASGCICCERGMQRSCRCGGGQRKLGLFLHTVVEHGHKQHRAPWSR